MFSYIETSQLICSANQLTGFYMMGTLAVKGLKQPSKKVTRNRVFQICSWQEVFIEHGSNVIAIFFF